MNEREIKERDEEKNERIINRGMDEKKQCKQTRKCKEIRKLGEVT